MKTLKMTLKLCGQGSSSSSSAFQFHHVSSIFKDPEEIQTALFQLLSNHNPQQPYRVTQFFESPTPYALDNLDCGGRKWYIQGCLVSFLPCYASNNRSNSLDLDSKRHPKVKTCKLSCSRNFISKNLNDSLFNDFQQDHLPLHWFASQRYRFPTSLPISDATSIHF